VTITSLFVVHEQVPVNFLVVLRVACLYLLFTVVAYSTKHQEL